MADDDLDIDALLEGPIDGTDGRGKSQSKEPASWDDAGAWDESSGKKRSRSRSKDRGERRRRSRSRDRDRKERDRGSKDRERRRRGSRSPKGERGERGSSSRKSRSPRGDRGGSRRRSRSRSPRRDRGGGRRGGGDRFGDMPRGRFGRGAGGIRSRSRSKTPDAVLTPEERDSRTIFVMQLSQRVRSRDVEEFFSAVGKIKDVKLIVCNKTRRFKGICYVEFKELDSVPLALGLNGQKLLGVPVIVQPSQAEKNRIAGSYADLMSRGSKDKGPMRLYIGSLHFNITEEMLKGIFEPFGKIQQLQLIMDTETGRSKGYGFVTFVESEDAKKALEQMNGFELAGRPMKVGQVTERADAQAMGAAGATGHGEGLDSDHIDRSGVDLGATGRLSLMAKLAEGTGMKLPQAASDALHVASTAPPQPNAHQMAMAERAAAQQQLAMTAPPIATQCFLLANMFDPTAETNSGWEAEVRDDVIEECSKYGGVQHIYVDSASATGNVYVKCPDTSIAVSAVNALHGRWFAGKVITAAYVPLVNYHNLFPDAAGAVATLQPSR